MATVERESIGLLNDKITVKIKQDDYLPAFEKSLKHYGKTLNIPGFRKGMVPPGLIRKMHGQAIFTDEIVQSVQRELGQYLENEKLAIFAQPLSLNNNPELDVNSPAEYDFNFEIGLKPEFSITVLQPSTHLPQYKITVPDEEVEKEVNRLQLKGGDLKEKEIISSEDDVLEIIFEETDEQGNVREAGIKKEETIMLKYFSGDSREKLLGKKKEDVIVLQLSSTLEGDKLHWLMEEMGFKKDDEEAAQKYFKITINKIDELQKRELTEEFFKEIYPNENIVTEDDFRKKIQEETEQYYAQQTKQKLENDLFEILVHETSIELPKAFLLRWLQISGDNPRTELEAESEYPHFDHQLRWTLVSGKLINDNKIEIGPEEIRAHIKKRVLDYYGLEENAEGTGWVDEYADRLMQDEKYLDQTYQLLITQKLFDWALTQVTLDEKEITPEEFYKLPNHHSHHHEHQ